MMNFVNTIFNTNTTTENGALSYSTTGKYRIDLFFYTCRKFTDMKLVEQSCKENLLDTLKIIFNARDCRGGKGERKLFRDSLIFLINNGCTNTIIKNLHLISFYGRWDDLIVLSDTSISNEVFKIIEEQLLEDYNNMAEGNPVTLLAKWLPSENKKLDKKLNFVSCFCKYMSWIPKKYRHYISTLREYLDIVEIKMTQNRWKEIEYSKVPSVAIHKLKKAFEKHDTDRYNEWKQKLAKNEVKVNSSQVFPHTLVNHYLTNKDYDEVVEKQWKNISKLNSLENTLVLSDVSGSMNGIPMQVSIALGILISNLVKPPFDNLVITFSESPTFHKVEGETLQEKVSNMREMNWGGNTDFQKVFDIILNKAINAGLENKDMPKRLFVLSDMQFDKADCGSFSTNYDTIKKKYKQFGYNMPQILFWNLRGYIKDFPVSDIPNVGLVSGFSSAILNAVLNDEEFSPSEEFSPYSIMRKTIDNERYNKISV